MELNGVPLHPLVVHAVVVLGPLAALTGLAYAAVPRWRWLLRCPLVALAAVVAVVALVAVAAGEGPRHRTGPEPSPGPSGVSLEEGDSRTEIT